MSQFLSQHVLLHFPLLQYGTLYDPGPDPFKIIAFALLFALVIYIIVKMSTKNLYVVSNWHHPFGDLQYSSQEFYNHLELLLKQIEMPGVTFSRVTYSESSIFSSKREYLRVERNGLIFDVCAAPFGRGFFVSWWLGRSVSPFNNFLFSIPLLGRAFEHAHLNPTYYQIDSENMFQETIHSNVLALVDAVTKEKGIRGLEGVNRAPMKGKTSNRFATT